MIYAYDLSALLRKGFGKDKVFSSQINKICEQMPIDPEVSRMDTVVLSSKDLKGLNRGKVQTALLTKNPNVTFIYIWSKKGEDEYLDTPFKVEMKKITAESLYSAVNDIISENLIKSGKLQVDAKDSQIVVPKPLKPKFKAGRFGHKEEEPEEPEVEIKKDSITGLFYFTDEVTDETIFCDEDGRVLTPAEIQIAKDKMSSTVTVTEGEDTDEEEFDLNMEDEDMSEPEDTSKVEPDDEFQPVKLGKEPEVVEVTAEVEAESSIKDDVKSVAEFHNWDSFKDALSETSVHAELIANQADYNATLSVLDALDLKMLDIMQDTTLSADERFNKLISIGRDRVTHKGVCNSIMVDKLVSIIHSVALSAGKIVKDTTDKYAKAFESASKVDAIVFDDKGNNEKIDEAVKAEFKLLNVKKEMASLYSVMNTSVQDASSALIKGLPSSNELINSTIGLSDEQFTPANTKELLSKMLQALEENSNTFIQADECLEKLIDAIADVMIKYREIMKCQEDRILLLKANRVEDIVIMDTALKPVMQLIVGESGSGVTATTLARAGVIARGAKNVAVLDLSGNAKFSDYGMIPVSWEDFSENRINREFICIQKPEVLHIDDIVSHLKTRLDNYGSIFVTLDPSQIDEASVLSDNAITLNFISDCTPRNMVTMSETISALSKIQNIARKVVLINPVTDIVSCCRNLSVELATTKVVTIPYLQEMKECLVNKVDPAMYPEIRGAFSYF